MRTAAYKVDVASDRRRRENVPRHILCYASKLVPEPIAEVRELFPYLSRIENSHPSNSGHRSQNCL